MIRLAELVTDGFECNDRMVFFKTHNRYLTSSSLGSGYHDIDEITNGFHNGDVIVLGGRPSIGKSSFAISLIEEIAIKGKVPTAVFSLETPSQQWATSMADLLIGQNKADNTLQSKERYAIRRISYSKIFIDDSPNISISELYSKSLAVNKEIQELQKNEGVEQATGLGLIVIDYFQLMQRSTDEDDEITDIFRSLKALAKELNVPIVIISQLDRSVERRDDKRPKASDLRELNAIEQYIDLIMLLYRDDYYDHKSIDKGLSEVIIEKNNNGSLGIAKFKINEPLFMYSSPHKDPFHLASKD